MPEIQEAVELVHKGQPLAQTAEKRGVMDLEGKGEVSSTPGTPHIRKFSRSENACLETVLSIISNA